jgi:divalent metal cation (Fe/Co/Zn/Cd) transporter
LAIVFAAALIGVLIAAAGLLVHQLGGPASSDAIASLLIGILLAATAIGLARPLADLLIGTSMRPERLRRAREILEASPALVLDSLDRQLRTELPEIGEVFIDVTAHRRPVEHDRG